MNSEQHTKNTDVFKIDYKDLDWWYWLVTAVLLSFGLLGMPAGFLLAIGLTGIQSIHFAIRERNTIAFPVQVRTWYLLLLVIVFPEPLRLIYWFPAIATWVQVIFGYSIIARCVSLLPWNRTGHLTLALLKKTFFSAPVRGNFMHSL